MDRQLALRLLSQGCSSKETMVNKGTQTTVFLVVKAAPWNMRVALEGGNVTFHDLPLRATLLYDTPTLDEEVDYIKQAPLRTKTFIRSDTELDLEVRMTTLTSQHEGMLFRIKVEALDPTTGQPFVPSVSLVSGPIKCISKPRRNRARKAASKPGSQRATAKRSRSAAASTPTASASPSKAAKMDAHAVQRLWASVESKHGLLLTRLRALREVADAGIAASGDTTAPLEGGAAPFNAAHPFATAVGAGPALPLHMRGFLPRVTSSEEVASFGLTSLAGFATQDAARAEPGVSMTHDDGLDDVLGSAFHKESSFAYPAGAIHGSGNGNQGRGGDGAGGRLGSGESHRHRDLSLAASPLFGGALGMASPMPVGTPDSLYPSGDALSALAPRNPVPGVGRPGLGDPQHFEANLVNFLAAYSALAPDEKALHIRKLIRSSSRAQVQHLSQLLDTFSFARRQGTLSVDVCRCPGCPHREELRRIDAFYEDFLAGGSAPK